MSRLAGGPAFPTSTLTPTPLPTPNPHPNFNPTRALVRAYTKRGEWDGLPNTTKIRIGNYATMQNVGSLSPPGSIG